MTGTLTWGLVVATKDRLDALSQCIGFALDQTHPPTEVIVVDASASWDRNRKEIAAQMAAQPDIRFTYLQAPRPSLTLQRNTGIGEARADILFLIDDDSFLYPTAAEIILRVYEADNAAMIAGIQLQPDPEPPQPIAGAGARKTSDVQRFRIRSGRLRRLVRWALQYGLEARWIPYDSAWPDRPAPDGMAPPALRPTRLFHGFRMTFRREIAARLQFDPLLLYYCPGEDLDFSHRAAREGVLLSARDARVHHYTSQGGRLKRRQVTLLAALNQALFLRQHATDLARARRAYRRSMLHRAFGDAVRDLGLGAPSLPGMRGTLRGLWMSHRLFNATLDEITAFYPALQERIVKEIRG